MHLFDCVDDVMSPDGEVGWQRVSARTNGLVAEQSQISSTSGSIKIMISHLGTTDVVATDSTLGINSDSTQTKRSMAGTAFSGARNEA